LATTGKTQRRAQTLLGLVILLIVAALALTLWLKPAPEELLPAMIDKLPENVDIGLDRVHYSQNENGRRSWVLDADRADYQRTSEELNLKGVELTYFDAGRFGNLHLTADQGVLLQQKNLVRVSGNVLLRADTGETFETQTLTFLADEGFVHSPDRVRYESPQLTLTGLGFRLEIENGRLRVNRDVHAVLTGEFVKGEQP